MNIKLLTLLSVFLATISLQACKHPLAIVGEGDIVDTNNSGHGCTLEQLQAQDVACIENSVRGDYFVNYKAEPRPGWRFVRWEGPCSPQSDFQYCRIESEADWVAWMDANYPDYEFPASTAVFEPITGEIGYLMDGAVAGVAYITPSQQGVTGTDGSFYYQENESVRFLIGSTLLGEVEGKERVTPFDLAGSPVITGHQMREASGGEDDEDEAIHAVINIAVLLQSLDTDADPRNGIEIRAAVAGLFHEVNLDVDQPWHTFREESSLRNAIASGNKRKLFSTVHGITHPTLAMNHLYEVLGISSPTMATNREESDEDGDGNPEEVTPWIYDVAGNLIQRGNESWTYDYLGNRTRHEIETPAREDSERHYYRQDGQVTLHSLDENNDGTPEYIESWEYDSSGHLVRYEEGEGDGPPESISTWQYQYDDMGRLTNVAYEQNSGDALSAVAVYQYRSDGRLARVEFEGGGVQSIFGQGALLTMIEPLDIPVIPNLGLAQTYVVSYEYDFQGNFTGDLREGLNSILGRYTESNQYDRDGNVTRSEGLLERYDEQVPEDIQHVDYHYDDSGKLLRKIIDNGGDGSTDVMVSYEYDLNGTLVRFEADRDADGEADEIDTWEYDYKYDASGNVILKELIGERDGTPEEITQYQYYANGTVAFEQHLNIEGGNDDLVSQWYYDVLGNVTLEEHDNGADGTSDRVVRYQYDDRNTLKRKETDGNGDGIPNSIESWQYDTEGNVTRYEVACDSELPVWPACLEVGYAEFFLLPDRSVSYEYDDKGNVTREVRDEDEDGDGYPDNIESYEYDAEGRVVRETIDEDGDGMPDEIYHFEYDTNGNVIRDLTDANGDGEIDVIATFVYEYDAEGHLTYFSEDEDSDGLAEQVSRGQFNSHGDTVLEWTDWDGDGVSDESSSWEHEYDARGNHIREEEDVGIDGGVNHIRIWYYDADERLIRVEQDEDADGDLEYIEILQYDASGNLVYAGIDGEGDGTPDRVWTYRYDASGNLIFESEADDWFGDGVLKQSRSIFYQTTGWGHIFND